MVQQNWPHASVLTLVSRCYTYLFMQTNHICSNTEVIYFLVNPVFKELKTENKGPDEGRVRLGLSTGEIQSQLCVLPQLSLSLPVIVCRVFFFPICKITQETVIRMSNFSIWGFYCVILPLTSQVKYSKNYEMAVLVWLSLNWTELPSGLTCWLFFSATAWGDIKLMEIRALSQK